MKLGRNFRPLPAGVPTLRKHAIWNAAAPESIDRSSLPFRPGLDHNDTLGDCTAVAVANAIRAQSAIRRFGVGITPEDTVAFYAASTGYTPSLPLSDVGGVEVDVLAYQARHGFRAQAQQPWCGLWANLELGNWNLMRSAIARVGTAYLGVGLAIADQHDGIWDTDTPLTAGNPAPGSWGGHALLAWDYTGTRDTDLVRLVTWGTFRWATWRWLKSRCDEAHVIVHRQLMDDSCLRMAGIDPDRAAADVAAFAQ